MVADIYARCMRLDCEMYVCIHACVNTCMYALVVYSRVGCPELRLHRCRVQDLTGDPGSHMHEIHSSKPTYMLCSSPICIAYPCSNDT